MGLSKEFICLTPNFTLPGAKITCRLVFAATASSRDNLEGLKSDDRCASSRWLLWLSALDTSCLATEVSGAQTCTVSKKLNASYKSGLKVKNPKAPAATRAIDGKLSSRERRGLSIKREARGQLFDFAFSERIIWHLAGQLPRQ
jgi:hypothetical protein